VTSDIIREILRAYLESKDVSEILDELYLCSPSELLEDKTIRELITVMLLQRVIDIWTGEEKLLDYVEGYDIRFDLFSIIDDLITFIKVHCRDRLAKVKSE